jgi:hypothetical protein
MAKSIPRWSIHHYFYRYTWPVAPRAARGPVAEIYAQLKRDLGSVADPIALHAPVPPLIAGAWAILREALVAGQAPRGHREAVAALLLVAGFVRAGSSPLARAQVEPLP